jgi:hypothetical protein
MGMQRSIRSALLNTQLETDGIKNDRRKAESQQNWQDGAVIN